MGIQRRIRLMASTAGLAGLVIVGAGIPGAAVATEACVAYGPPAATATVDQHLTSTFEHYGDTAGRWTGADSAYSVPLPGGRIAWLYSDSFTGVVNADHSRPNDSPFIHNSINIIGRRGSITTYTGGTNSAPDSLIAPPGVTDQSQDWYWVGDGTVEGSHLRVMLLEFVKTGPGAFDIAFTRSAVASFSLTDMHLEGITARPAGTVEWGSAIYEDGGYTYVYGVEDLGSVKYMHLARVRTGQLTTGVWQFFGDAGWSTNEGSSKRIMDGVANEFSVTKFQGKYTLVTSDSTVPLSAQIVAYRSDSLTGPFIGKTVLYTTPETGGNIFTYNAKAHPEYGNPNTLVVSYNVNSFDTNDVYRNVDNYRPRYVDVTVAFDRPHDAPHCTPHDE